MKYKIFTVIILFFLFLNIKSQHLHFGIDLNKDWYTLTNYSGLTYNINEANNKELPYVFSDFNFINSKVDEKFLRLGFDESIIGFPKGKSNTDLHLLKPICLIAYIIYDNIDAYSKNSFINITNIQKVLVEEFGSPISYTHNQDKCIIKWETIDYHITLSSSKIGLETVYTYTKI